MAFRIDEITSSVNKYGVQKASHFACNISLPPSLNNGIMDQSPFRVSSINFPGFTLGTDDIRVRGYGLAEKRPIQTSFDDISVTIIADASGRIQDKLMDWMEYINPIDPERAGVGQSNVEYYEYPNNYYGGLESYIYDGTGKIHTTYTFIQAYPTMIGAIQMGWENNDTLILIPVTFAYRSYKKNSQYKNRVDIVNETNQVIIT